MWFVLTESTIPGPWRSNDPRPSPDFFHGCEIKSGIGLGTRLLFTCTQTKVKMGGARERAHCLSLQWLQEGHSFQWLQVQSDEERELLTTPGYNKAIQHHHVMQHSYWEANEQLSVSTSYTKNDVIVTIINANWLSCSHMSMFQQCIVRGWS